MLSCYYHYCMFSVLQLADSSVEACLRDLGFGYRARFLQQSAKQILDTYGLQWLESLRSVPYLQARDALRTLPGVGTKVQQPHVHSTFTFSHCSCFYQEWPTIERETHTYTGSTWGSVSCSRTLMTFGLETVHSPALPVGGPPALPPEPQLTTCSFLK